MRLGAGFTEKLRSHYLRYFQNILYQIGRKEEPCGSDIKFQNANAGKSKRGQDKMEIQPCLHKLAWGRGTKEERNFTTNKDVKREGKVKKTNFLGRSRYVRTAFE